MSAACWWLRQRSIAARALRRGWPSNRPRCVCRPGERDQQEFVGPNTLIKQGAKLVATWEDVWEELPTDIQAVLSATRNESAEPEPASLFPDEARSPHEIKILKLLKADESTHISINWSSFWKTTMSSSEIFARTLRVGAEWEDTAVAGEEFCEELLVVSYQLSVSVKTGDCAKLPWSSRLGEVTPAYFGCLLTQ